MRLALGLAAVVASVLLIGTQAAGGAEEREPCASKGSTTQYRVPGVRVFTKRASWYGCQLGRNSIVRLGRSRGEPFVNSLEVNGRYVAYLLTTVPFSSQGPFGTDVVRMIDLQARRRYAPERGCDQPPVRGNGVTEIALNNRGHVAWICLQTFADRPTHHRALRLFHPSRGTRVLDTADDAAIESLALTDDRVYWTTAGDVRSLDLRR